ncbi:hypothetical protein [Fluviicola taffensis]|uniref:hypothetical protein n=1 Tax=Fluviicola taffensis TaxID=191579 RepID=UPI003138493C
MDIIGLKEHFQHVRMSALWSDYYSKTEDFSLASVLDKQVLRETLVSKFNLQEEKGVYLVRSGGSTQKPLVFPVDIQENLAQRQLLANELVANGVFSSSTIALNVFSYGDMYRTASIMDDILDRCSATTLALSATSTYETMAAVCADFQPNTLMGTPSKLVLFARFLQKEGISCLFDSVLFAGEFLLPSQQEILSEVFQPKAIYSMYGSTETGIWAWAHYSKNPRAFHFLKEVVVEIFNPDSEGYGEIVVTNLIRKRFPLFRYRMGDIGKVVVENDREVLLLKEREQKSFSLHESAYFLHDFEPLLQGIDRFQIQLSLKTDLLTQVRFLLVKPQVSLAEREKLIQQVKDGIDQIIEWDPRFAAIDVELVAEDALYINPTTSKTPWIVDFRN